MCAVIGDFQMDQCHVMLKELHMGPYMVTKEGVSGTKHISIGSHCIEKGNFMLHFNTFHNVSTSVKFPQKLVMVKCYSLCGFDRTLIVYIFLCRTVSHFFIFTLPRSNSTDVSNSSLFVKFPTLSP